MELYDLILSAKLTKGGGGSDVSVDPLSVTENGTYTAEDGHAYSPVTVNVSGVESRLDLLRTQSLGHIETSSTSETNTGLTTVFNSRDDFNDYEMLVVIVSADEEVNNSLIATVGTPLLYGDSNAHYKNSVYVPSATTNYKLNSDGSKMLSASNNTSYGIYVKGGLSGSTLTLTYYTKYSSLRTGTINGNYTARIYGLKLIDLVSI